MIGKPLLRAVMLGLCMASLSTGTAFAMATESVAPTAVIEEISPELQKLYDRQKEIDRILFEEHAKDMEKMGFIVSSTGVVEDAIEISISPYEEKFVDYIYELVGQDGIKVTEMDQSILYATGVAHDQPVTDSADTEVVDTEDSAEDAELADQSGLVEEDGDTELQTESVKYVILMIAGVAVLAGGILFFSLRNKNTR